MRVRFGDEMLRRLAVDAEFWPGPWGLEVMRSFRRRLQSLTAARDHEDLRHVRCLDLKDENGRDAMGCSIRLVDRTRLLLEFDAVRTDEVTVVGIAETDTWEVAQ